MLLAGIVLAVISALTFEFARMARTYDYRSFLRAMIGPFWIGFEACIAVLFLIVIAIVASAAGTLLSDRMGIPETPGLLLMLCIIGVLAWFGRELVEKVMIVLTVLLFVAFTFYFVAVIHHQGDWFDLRHLDAIGQTRSSWVMPALQFAFYTSPIAPCVLFATRGITERKDALLSGGLCGLIFMVPAYLFHLSFLGALPAIVEQKVPVYWMIEQLRTPLLTPVYLLAMLGTFIGTATGFIQAINERLDYWVKERVGKALSPRTHTGVAAAGFLISAALGQFGISALIAKGYGTVAGGFMIFFVIPVLTIGPYRVFFKNGKIGPGPQME